MTKIIGKIIAQIRPYSNINMIFEMNKEISKKLIFTSSIAYIKIIVFIMIWNCNVIDMTINFFEAWIVEIEEHIIYL